MPEATPWTALGAIQRGLPFGRDLTPMERVCVAVLFCEPAYHLTLHTQDMNQRDLHRAFCLLKRRIERSKSRSGPLIYVAHPARSLGADRYHLHVLYWEFLRASFLHRHCDEVGFGVPLIQRVPLVMRDGLGDPSRPEDALQAMKMVRYVFGQQDAVFGSSYHQRHDPVEHAKRRIWNPQDRTLGTHKLELLSALEWARTPGLSTDELLLRLPKFSYKYPRLGSNPNVLRDESL